MKTNNKPILVTGSHRSGSTWVGQMLSLAPSVKYVSEPFNPGYGLKKIQSWFVYINEKNEAEYEKEIARLLKFQGRYRLNLPALRYWSNLLWPFYKKPLIKDPIACFSSAWLANKFSMDVVVLWRHPVAFYASLKRLNWRFDFTNFLDQPDLMTDHLNNFRDLIAKENKSYAEEAAILWLCIYFVLDKYSASHPNWIIKRHEDISLDPVGEFKDIYHRLGLNFSNKTEKAIIKYSSGKISDPTKALDLKRNSRSIVSQWLKRVDGAEIQTIKDITGELAFKYYPQEQWQ